jgi:hypothetical protein
VIRHVVLFKFKPGISWDDPRARLGERTAAALGGAVPELRDWQVGRNISKRDIAYDFMVDGLVEDEAALQRYLVDSVHQESIRLWREISDWVVIDVEV